MDLSRPWAVFEEWVYDPNTNFNSVVCQSVVNPTSWAIDAPRMTTWTEPVASASLDVACNDRSGYSSYRVSWFEAPPWRAYFYGAVDILNADTNPSSQMRGVPVPLPGEFGWGTSMLAPSPTAGTISWADSGFYLSWMQVSGFDGSTFHPLATGIGKLLNATGVDVVMAS